MYCKHNILKTTCPICNQDMFDFAPTIPVESNFNPNSILAKQYNIDDACKTFTSFQPVTLPGSNRYMDQMNNTGNRIETGSINNFTIPPTCRGEDKYFYHPNISSNNAMRNQIEAVDSKTIKVHHGSLIGNKSVFYKHGKNIAAGGCGETTIYKPQDDTQDIGVVKKFFKLLNVTKLNLSEEEILNLPGNPKYESKILSELKLGAPNITKQKGQYAVFMKHIKGSSKHPTGLKVREHLLLLARVYWHALNIRNQTDSNIIHLDLKPANILYDEQHINFCDWGFAWSKHIPKKISKDPDHQFMLSGIIRAAGIEHLTAILNNIGTELLDELGYSGNMRIIEEINYIGQAPGQNLNTLESKLLPLVDSGHYVRNEPMAAMMMIQEDSTEPAEVRRFFTEALSEPGIPNVNLIITQLNALKSIICGSYTHIPHQATDNGKLINKTQYFFSNNENSQKYQMYYHTLATFFGRIVTFFDNYMEICDDTIFKLYDELAQICSEKYKSSFTQSKFDSSYTGKQVTKNAVDCIINNHLVCSDLLWGASTVYSSLSFHLAYVEALIEAIKNHNIRKTSKDYKDKGDAISKEFYDFLLLKRYNLNDLAENCKILMRNGINVPPTEWRKGLNSILQETMNISHKMTGYIKNVLYQYKVDSNYSFFSRTKESIATKTEFDVKSRKSIAVTILQMLTTEGYFLLQRGIIIRSPFVELMLDCTLFLVKWDNTESYMNYDNPIIQDMYANKINEAEKMMLSEKISSKKCPINKIIGWIFRKT
jgi:serine/threonine protein kinase